MNGPVNQQHKPGLRALAPLGDRAFRNIWMASLLSNLGQLVLGVAAAWQMTRLTNSPQMVALVQTAMMLPLMIVTVPAGAVADMFDRRRIALTGLTFSAIAAAVLTGLSASGLAGPWVLLGFCAMIGAGVALYAPSWQASIAEQVPPDHLPAAAALGSVSYNIARSFGPALGGLVVVAFGPTTAFGATSLLYLPLLLAFFLWKRRTAPPRLPPERLDRAIISGARYAIHASPARTVMIRAFFFGGANAALIALTPLVAREILGGDATTYGILLGAIGVGAVFGALFVSDARERLSTERALAIAMTVAAATVLTVAFSRSLPLTCLALFFAGSANMLIVSLLNVAMQVSVPRWVSARAIAWFQSSLTGGLAMGAWLWGIVGANYGLQWALAGSALMLLLTPSLGLLMPLRRRDIAGLDPVELGSAPNVALAITARSGPIIIEIDYRVDPDTARLFYDIMLKLHSARMRNGAFGWSLARDIGDPALWTERFEFPTWQDYLRHRDRFTESDRQLQVSADAFNTLEAPRVRRKLGRPFGSVRWRAETPVPSTEQSSMFTP